MPARMKASSRRSGTPATSTAATDQPIEAMAMT